MFLPTSTPGRSFSERVVSSVKFFESEKKINTGAEIVFLHVESICWKKQRARIFHTETKGSSYFYVWGRIMSWEWTHNGFLYHGTLNLT